MKYGKKILAAALAALLALSVLTACSGSSIKIDGNKLAEAITNTEGFDPVEYDGSLDKTAKDAMDAIKAKVGTRNSDGVEITMENAIVIYTGTLCKGLGNFTSEGEELKQKLGLGENGVNTGRQVIVALINAKNKKNKPAELAQMIKKSAMDVGGSSDVPNKMGYCENGDYVLVVLAY